jgi:DNA-binding MarR family transcriptional regulator
MASAHAWRSSLSSRLAPDGVTPAQFFVLASMYRRQIDGKSPLSQRQVAERNHMDVNVVSQVARSLARRELIERRVNPGDLRANQLVLTDRGFALSKKVTAAARRLNDEFFESIEGEALATILKELTHVI